MRHSATRTLSRHIRYSALLILPLFVPNRSAAVTLRPATLQAWDDYTASVTKQLEDRLLPGNCFLWVDESPVRLEQVRAGKIIDAPVGRHNPMHVPSGLIHHWIGAAFIPNVSLSDVFSVVRNYNQYKIYYQPTVVDSKTLATSETEDRYSMVLMNKSFFASTAFDADYVSKYTQVDAHRVYSVSRSTRVQEIDDYGKPGQHLLPQGQGAGIIWSIFGIARYYERDGGVYLELDGLVLSRDIPVLLRWFVEPAVRRISQRTIRASLEQAVKAVKSRDTQ